MVTRSLYAGQSFKIIEREVLHGPIKGRNKKVFLRGLKFHLEILSKINLENFSGNVDRA